MKLDKSVTPAAALLLALYTVYAQPLGTALVTFGIAAILFGFTKSMVTVAFVMIVPFAIKLFNAALYPKMKVKAYADPSATSGAPIEGFQAKDPASIHARIVESKQPAPLQPGIANPTGVLESPHILDNTPLQSMESLSSEALPGASIPASAKARVLIYPPAEKTVPATGIREYAPFANPVLQNGPDDDGVDTALISSGTEMPVESGAAELRGVSAGAGAAF